MMMLDDELRGYEAIARAACAVLADTVTSREFGMHSSADGQSWLDITIVESESTGDPRNNAELTIELRLTSVVRDSLSSRASTLSRWLESHAMRIMLDNSDLTPLWADIQGRRTEELISNLSSTPIPIFTSTTRLRRRGAFMSYPVLVDGLTVAVDGDGATGHAIGTTTAPIVTWRDPGPAIAPNVGELLYAGALLGDTIDVVDSNGSVIESLTPPTLPTGTTATSALPAGVYILQLAGAVSSFSRTVSQKPS
jgi:hypothetical protein